MMMVEEKMEANKASASSHGAAFEAMNGDAGKETTKKEQQQETFSPQVLKAVEEIFESRSVKEVREIEVRTRKEADDKQEELRQIIGSSYKDAIANADDLVQMSEENGKVERVHHRNQGVGKSVWNVRRERRSRGSFENEQKR